MNQDFSRHRLQMIQEQLVRRGIKNPDVLAAMETVPRHLFVPSSLIPHAYSDGPLPIGEGQTISQPYIVALMIEAARVDAGSNILEIGTGSGYAAAVISRIAKEVHTIERLPTLARNAENVLKSLDYQNVYVHIGDGSLGLPGKAPFDAIIVTAGAPALPASFLDQLKPSGRVIIPIGDALSQQLVRFCKIGPDKYSQEIIEYVRFVPLIGKEGWIGRDY
jgi:protein-L-isoaspartate(D-aspartate) O-methyltransferase